MVEKKELKDQEREIEVGKDKEKEEKEKVEKNKILLSNCWKKLEVRSTKQKNITQIGGLLCREKTLP